jgi:predicted small secreted protein
VTRDAAARLALASTLLLLGACRNAADGAREDARRAAREVEKAADDAKREVDRVAREAQRAAEDARHEVRQAVGEARGAMREAQAEMKEAGRDAQRGARESAADLNAAKQVVDVRTALAVSREISSASDIRVRGAESGHAVILVGTAATAAERAAAERIARGSADGMRVENRLRGEGAH